MLKINDGRKLISSAFGDPLRVWQFEERKRMTFVRGTDGIQELIAFGGRVTGGRFCFSLGLGLRFEAVENALERDANQELFATVGTPLHLLIPGKRYLEWCVEDSSQMAAAVPEVLQLIQQYGEPFLQKFRDMHNVRDRLRSASPSDWFTLPPEERAEILDVLERLTSRSS